MKKICLLTLGLAAAASLSAQVSAVKEADKAFKAVTSYAAYQKAVQALEPAFTNPETSVNAQTFWIPGKAGFKLYDELSVLRQTGKNVTIAEMGGALLDGYKYGFKALAVDTVVDAKGKAKTKFSKEIVTALGSHHNDLANIGSGYWDAKDFDKAYEAFKTYLELPDNKSLGESTPKALTDSVKAQIYYYMGLASWQAQRLDESAIAFDKMMEIGHDEINAYDYAYSVAYQMGDEARKLKYSQIAFEKFGSKKLEFLQRIIQSYISDKKYDDAMALLNKAIAADPNNGTYYYMIGVLYDERGDKENSQSSFKKAVTIDPNNPMANFSYGTSLIQEYERLDEATANMSQAEYNAYKAEKMNPLLKDASTYLEKAYELDNEMTNALTNLKIVYYNLNDAANLERIEKLML